MKEEKIIGLSFSIVSLTSQTEADAITQSIEDGTQANPDALYDAIESITELAIHRYPDSTFSASGFGVFRRELARFYNVNLNQMEGFGFYADPDLDIVSWDTLTSEPVAPSDPVA